MSNNYSAAVWRGYGQERDRWAVHCQQSGCYYFPARYGREAAERMAAQMNRNA